MATTEEIVAKYRLDLDELKTQVSELQAQFKKVDDGAQKSASGVDKAFGKLNDKLKQLGAAVVAAFAVDKIIGFGKASVEAFAEAEQGALKLSAAVAGQGGLTGDFNKLNDQAEELAGLTIFDDDTIRNAQTAALQFGLNADAVKALIPVVADFAAATGQDLNGALQTVIAGINGQERALKPYGVALDGATTRNERLALITDQLTGKFKGQAEALTQTLGGSITQAEKAYDDLQETVGQALAPIVTDLATGLTGIFKALQDPPIDGLRKEQEELNATAIEVYGLKVGTDQRTEAIKKLQETYPGYLGNLNAEKVGNDELRKALKKVNDELTFKIAQEQLATELQPLREKAAAAAVEEAKARKELAKQLSDVYDRSLDVSTEEQKKQILQLQNLDIATQAYKLQQGQVKLSGISTISLQGVAEGYATLRDKSAAAAVANEELNQKLEDADKTVAQLRKSLGIPIEANVEVKTTGLEGLTEDEKKAAEERRKAREKEIADRLKAAQQAAAAEAKTTEELRAKELQASQNYLDIYLTDQKLAIDKRYQAERDAAAINAQQQQDELVKQLSAGLITQKQYEDKKAAILKSIPNTEGEQAQEIAELEATILAARLNNLNDYTVDRAKLLQQIADQEAAITAAQAAQDPAALAQLENQKAIIEERLALLEFEAEERVRIQQELAAKEQALAVAVEPTVVTQLQAEKKALEERLALLTTDASQRLKLEQDLTQKTIALDAARAKRDPAFLEQLRKEQEALRERLATLQDDAAERLQIEQQLAANLAAIDTTTDPAGAEQLAREREALQARLALFKANAAERLKVEQELRAKTLALRIATDPNIQATLEQEKRVLEERLAAAGDNAEERAKIEQALRVKTAEIEALKTKNEKDEGDKRVNNAEDEAARKAAQKEKELEDQKAYNQRALELSNELATQIISLGTQLGDQKIEQLNAEKEAQLADFEQQQATLDEQYNQRLLGQAQYEAQSQQIAQQKVKTEQEIAQKVKEIRQRQDAARKAQALFNIAVDTASAIQAQLKTTPLPAGAPLVALIAASGLAQAGIVLSQKTPQYAEGVDFVPLGKNKKGRDTIPALLDEGERVISRKKNLKHWDLYQSIDQDRLPQYIFQTFTLPVLQRERERSQQVFHQLTTALHRQSDTLGASTVSVSTSTSDPAELRRLWRRGLSINNLDELAEVLDRRQPSPYRA